MYLKRLSELNKIAEEEGIEPPTSDSMNSLFEFISKLTYAPKEASLTLSDSGALRAHWLNDEWRLALTFPGKSQIKYVLGSRTLSNKIEYGTTTIDKFIIDFSFREPVIELLELYPTIRE